METHARYPTKISELIEEIRVLRLVDINGANELEERTFGRSAKSGPTTQPSDDVGSVGLLL